MGKTQDLLIFLWGDGTSTQFRGRGTARFFCMVLPQVASGGYFSAAVSESGELYCWGHGKDGQLGHGDLKARLDAAHGSFDGNAHQLGKDK